MITHPQHTLFAGNEGRAIDNRLVAGIALVALGALFLIAQLTNSSFVGTLILPALALVFLVWGITTHKAGLMIPAGIFIGLGLGTWIVMNKWVPQGDNGQLEGGVFLLAFALGWASITLLTYLFTNEIHWWPLIPAAILGLIGALLVLGDPALNALVWLGYIWPIALIAIGVYLLFRRAARQ